MSDRITDEVAALLVLLINIAGHQGLTPPQVSAIEKVTTDTLVGVCIALGLCWPVVREHSQRTYIYVGTRPDQTVQ